jgi:16S rRNA (guanine527-N7)-methyltransferase
VKHPFNLGKFFSFLDSQSIDLSDSQKNQFREYQTQIISESEKQNLVSRNDIAHLVERHFLPSVFLAKCLPEIITGKLIDIGSGAGFPGIILKIIRPEISLTLLDSSHKKVLFLEKVCEDLYLDCHIINQRCEDYVPESSEGFYIGVSRAVASLKLLWTWSNHLILPEGHLYVFKGGDYQQETDDLSQYNIKYEVITPEKNWLEVSEYLNHKNIIKLEK